MPATHILVIEDEAKTAQMVRLYLERAGFAVTAVGDGRRGVEAALSGEFDLVVLDLMLPGLDGRAICRRLQSEAPLPIIMLTALTTEDDRVAGLELGADDYVAKPFSPRELVARVRAVLRRSGGGGGDGEDPAPLVHGDLSLDPANRLVQAGSNRDAVQLTPSESALLAALLSAAGRVLSRGQLLQAAAGPDAEAGERTVDAHIANLRGKLAAAGADGLIHTVFGTGYRLGEPTPPRPAPHRPAPHRPAADRPRSGDDR